MLEVVLFRTNEIEIYDEDIQREAIWYRFKIFASAILAVSWLVIYLFLTIYFPSSPSLNVFLIIMLIFGLIAAGVVIWDSSYDLRTSKLGAIKLYFKKGKLQRMVKLNRISLQSNIYSEEEVRIDQAVGLRVIEENHIVHNTVAWTLRTFRKEDELFFNGYVVEIVYDFQGDGVPIFRSYNPETIQQFILTIKELLPNIKKVSYHTCTKKDVNSPIRYLEYQTMDREDQSEFNDPRVTLPKEIREFLKEKYKIL